MAPMAWRSFCTTTHSALQRLGGGGGGLGAAGIRNGLAIQFDTYPERRVRRHRQRSHQLHRHRPAPGPARLSSQVDLGNIEDGKWHKVQVSWDVAQQTLSYSFDGQQAGTLTGNLASSYFG